MAMESDSHLPSDESAHAPSLSPGQASALLRQLSSMEDAHPEDKLAVVLRLARHHCFTDRHPRAVALAEEAATLAVGQNKVRDHLAALNLIGVAARFNGDVARSVYAFSSLQQRASQVGDASHHTLGALNLGYTFLFMDDHEGALAAFTDSKRIAELYNSPPNIAQALCGTAQTHLKSGDLAGAKGAIRAAESTLATLNSDHPRLRALLTTHQAWLHMCTGRETDSIRMTTETLDDGVLTLPGDAQRLHYLLARSYQQLGQLAEAETHANLAMAFPREPMTDRLMSRCAELRAHIRRKQGRIDEAWDDLTYAADLARRATFAAAGAALRQTVDRYHDELQLREAELEARNHRLAIVVGDLKTANRRLNKEFAKHRQTQANLSDAHAKLVDAARTAGMAEVTTGVVHDIGNAVNSLLVSSQLLADTVRTDTLPERLKAVATRLNQQDADPKLCAYLTALASRATGTRKQSSAEVDRLNDGVKHIANIVTVQQRSATSRGIVEPSSTGDMLHEAVQLALSNRRTVIPFKLTPGEDVQMLTAPHRVVQILNNLLRNAYDATDGQPQAKRWIRAGCERSDANTMTFFVEDSGPGVPELLRSSIFAHGFTTKTSGNGFGLHASALGAIEMGGGLTLAPPAASRGARFELSLPIDGAVGAVDTSLSALERRVSETTETPIPVPRRYTSA